MTSKPIHNLLCLGLILLGTQSFPAQSQTKETPAMNHTQIQSTIDTNNAAVAARDIEAILATYEPNAVLTAQPGMTVMGTTALRESFKYFLALDPKLTVTNEELIQAGDVALHTYAWKMNAKAPDGTPIEQSGLSTIVLRKQPDGRWLMLIDNPFGDQPLHKK